MDNRHLFLFIYIYIKTGRKKLKIILNFKLIKYMIIRGIAIIYDFLILIGICNIIIFVVFMFTKQ